MRCQRRQPGLALKQAHAKVAALRPPAAAGPATTTGPVAASRRFSHNGPAGYRVFHAGAATVLAIVAANAPLPEGPSLVILREALQPFEGKQLLLEFDPFTVRIHFLLYGSWLVDERKEATPRLSLGFARGREANFYACSVRFLVDPLDELYDRSGDVMSDTWDAAQARRKLRATPDRMVADVLLDQDVFAGVGNIIKNEVLHRIRLHPGSRAGALSARKLGDLVRKRPWPLPLASS